MLQCYSDRIKCKVFLTSGKGDPTVVQSARAWHDYLVLGFQRHFLTPIHLKEKKNKKKTTLIMFNVKRTENEPLREFVKHFNEMALEVPSCPVEVQITAVIQGLKGVILSGL